MFQTLITYFVVGLALAITARGLFKALQKPKAGTSACHSGCGCGSTKLLKEFSKTPAKH